MSDLLLLFSGLRTKKVIFFTSYALLTIYMLVVANWQLNVWFQLVNIFVLLFVAGMIHLLKGIPNAILSILSKLIYSVLIDFICYFWFPMFTNGATLIQYIWNGIVFNWKSLLIDTCVFAAIVVVKMIVEKKYENKIISTRQQNTQPSNNEN